MRVAGNRAGGRLAAALFLAAAAGVGAWEYDPMTFDSEQYEEDAGPSFAVLLNPADEIYGIHFGWGTWLKKTPVFGDYSLSLFSNGIEDAFYAGIGMTLRLMPHWKAAPFVGVGGNFNYSLSGVEPDLPEELRDPDDLEAKGDNYWGGYVESGVRIWLKKSKMGLFEIMGRYTWSSLAGDRDYWLVGISTGVAY